jgi:hypothetical protein
MVNTGQMLMVLGALLLFSLAMPSINGSLLYNDRTLLATNAELTAISIAEKVLADAGSKAFDEICLTMYVQHPADLTQRANFGKDTGENYPNFDDVDDYHNLAAVDTTTLRSVRFNIAGNVEYMDPAHPDQISASRTYVKRLQVTVTSPFMTNPASNQAVQVTMERLYTLY